MTALCNFLENRMIDGQQRGGCLTTAGAAGPSTVVKGIWTAATPYVAGDIVVPHANMTGAGGKLLMCTVAGTTASTNTLAVPNPGATLADGGVTWKAIATIPALDQMYAAMIVANGKWVSGMTVTTSYYVLPNTPNGHIYKCTTAGTAGGTEPTWPTTAGGTVTDGSIVWTEQSTNIEAGTFNEATGGSYARVAVPCTLAEWAGTQGAGTTTASSGTNGTTSNNVAITYPAPTADWGWCFGIVFMDLLTGGNALWWSAATTPQMISNGNAAPSIAIGALTYQQDN